MRKRKNPFRGRSRAELSARIDDLCLSDQDATIAKLAILHDMDFSEIAPYAHCDRTTVSRHCRDLIKII